MESQDKLSHSYGQLFIVATPIGNLKDMTYRAVETLKKVDWIAAEDTRVSRYLLEHYDITAVLFACHDHNEVQAAKGMIERLKAGESGALISDAGTPLINDPGYRLVKEVRKQGLDVIPVPGACSPIAALCASGLATDQFTYMGFLPRSGKSRHQQLQQLAMALHTCVFLESPKRIVKTLLEMQKLMAHKEICIGRELTKIHEEFISGTTAELLEHFEGHAPRGEMVVMVGLGDSDGEISDGLIIKVMTESIYRDMSPSSKARAVAQQLGVKRSRVYDLLLQQ